MSKYFRIHYSGIGRADNIDWIEADTLQEAENIAYECALEDYDSYAGLHGIPDFDSIAEDMFDMSYDELDGDQMAAVEDQYNEERQSWIDCWAEEIPQYAYEHKTEYEDEEEE